LTIARYRCQSLPPPSLWIHVHSSCNQSKVKCYSFPTAVGRSNSKNHRAGHPLGIKWFHRNELYTLHLLPTPSAILFTSPTRTTSRIEPLPPILTAGASTRTTMVASRCWLAHGSPPLLPRSLLPKFHPGAGPR
jgi:hypothetical protein